MMTNACTWFVLFLFFLWEGGGGGGGYSTESRYDIEMQGLLWEGL